MKRLLIISLLFCVGCVSLPLRNQIRLGMNQEQVEQLYERQEFREILSEQTTEKCTLYTYRYWFDDPKKNPFIKPLPYLLTFQSCRLPNYEAVLKESERRITIVKKNLKNDPNFQMELDAFCKENELNPEDRKIAFTLLVFNAVKSNYPPLPQCTTDDKLIKIAFDESTVRYRKTREAEFQQRQAETRRWLRQGY